MGLLALSMWCLELPLPLMPHYLLANMQTANSLSVQVVCKLAVLGASEPSTAVKRTCFVFTRARNRARALNE